MAICLASAGIVKVIAATAFTLAWTHSVEKVEWQEDWRVSSAGLELIEARVKGSGAGMEPPPEARLREGWFSWTPQRPPRNEIGLGHSGAAGDWRICVEGQCRTLTALLDQPPSPDGAVLRACTAVPR